MRNITLQQNHLVNSFHSQINEDQLNDLIIRATETEKAFLAISISIDQIDVLAALEQVSNRDSFQYYWEKVSDEFSISAAGELARIKNEGDSRFRESSKKGKALLNNVYHHKAINHQNAEVHLFGGFSFFEKNNSRNWKTFGASSFTLPEWMIVREGKCTILTFAIELQFEFSTSEIKEEIYNRLQQLEPICNVEEYITNSVDKSSSIKIKDDSEFEHIHWIETVNRAKKCIDEGRFDKVVLARELIIDLPKSVKDTHILHNLRRQYPDCYCFLIRHENSSSFIGCTPERLASFKSNFILTEGLAGSISRGKTASEDVMLENNLLGSTKDLHEHEIVLSAIEQQLAPYSLSIKHPAAPSVKKLSNVQHLYTPITATIHEDVSRTEVLKNLHPTPAVGGYPRSEAVKFIQQHEDFDRGWYAAPIGWINTSGNGEFAVAIRSGLIMENQVRFFAGCGIVQDSDPQKEWDETNMKFIPMLTALEYAGS
jgi:menaquinone-specific isochorismate synthase